MAAIIDFACRGIGNIATSLSHCICASPCRTADEEADYNHIYETTLIRPNKWIPTPEEAASNKFANDKRLIIAGILLLMAFEMFICGAALMSVRPYVKPFVIAIVFMVIYFGSLAAMVALFWMKREGRLVWWRVLATLFGIFVAFALVCGFISMSKEWGAARLEAEKRG